MSLRRTIWKFEIEPPQSEDGYDLIEVPQGSKFLSLDTYVSGPGSAADEHIYVWFEVPVASASPCSLVPWRFYPRSTGAEFEVPESHEVERYPFRGTVTFGPEGRSPGLFPFLAFHIYAGPEA